jgi:hypothetical protein
MAKIHFVCTNDRVERQAIKVAKPTYLLLSYYYWKGTNIQGFIDEIGYKPKLMLDSGAFSSFTKGKNASIIDYMNYIKKNEQYFDSYISLDVMDDPDISIKYYEIMKMKGFNPIPVYHYGDDEMYLKYYIEEGEKYIALGKTVPLKKKFIVADWINELMAKYPDVKFHLLGSSSSVITRLTNVYSMDASSWMHRAIKGYPKDIVGNDKEAKTARAIYQLREIMQRSEEEC